MLCAQVRNGQPLPTALQKKKRRSKLTTLSESQDLNWSRGTLRRMRHWVGFLPLLIATSCDTRHEVSAMPSRSNELAVVHRTREGLPFVDLGWVSIRDHFVQTVGPNSGQGSPYGDLLVVADALFEPHSRFPLHAHENMEIVSIVVAGTLTHHEPGKSVAIPERAAQLMSARSGITHAEANHTDTPVRMLQIWLKPNALNGIAKHRVFGPHTLGPRLERVVPDGMRQDAVISMARLSPGERLVLSARDQRALYVICLEGEAEFGGKQCADGDGLLITRGKGELEALARLMLVVLDLRRPATDREAR